MGARRIVSDQLVILVPVLDRPHRVAPLLDSIEAATSRARVVFLTDSFDVGERRAITREHEARHSDDGLRINERPEGGGYAEKINSGVAYPRIPESLLFLGADDLVFESGWFEAAMAHMVEGIEVVGVNDLLPRRRRRRRHATHFLMTRKYAERPTIDGGRGPLSETYTHCCVDDELIATATARGVYAYAEDSHVRHLHWMNGGAEVDATYQRGIDSIEADKELFHEREHLWA